MRSLIFRGKMEGPFEVMDEAAGEEIALNQEVGNGGSEATDETGSEGRNNSNTFAGSVRDLVGS
jgi:hypothetical protein